MNVPEARFFAKHGKRSLPTERWRQDDLFSGRRRLLRDAILASLEKGGKPFERRTINQERSRKDSVLDVKTLGGRFKDDYARSRSSKSARESNIATSAKSAEYTPAIPTYPQPMERFIATAVSMLK